ncbi:carboxymuconolactone decarboxylase family protein [Paracoccus sp. S1E-3]|uniref:carboxymuconolactone decarboxylase family protein n=1 Tax=Paracoccus sp. S1E-3 TaxID=2756130 RepID=UPI0015EE468D|nr:carboxymuconolactone decarboxylase family protein [Paracoccus sp. S1E-3]MBA4489171.1 carboxymuconolactone decarboxylase family protein [Paracoccus sp. S1E-3]
MTIDFKPIADSDWPESLAALKGGFATGLNVYRTMAHHPALLAAWAPLRSHVVSNPSLSPDQSEVVILRTGHRLGAAYEWAHHVHRGRRIGMSDARIATIAGPLDAMADADATLAQAVDELFDNRRLSPATQQALLDLVGAQGMFDLIATVGFYSVLGFIVESFDTPIDTAIAAELQERPLAT